MDRPAVTITDWTALLARLGVGEAPGAAARGTDLLDRYDGEERRYHSLDHLTAVLAVVDQLAELADEPDLVRIAAWYHDAIHEPDGLGGDEQLSADVARTDLTELGLDDEAVAETARLVLLTTTHDPGPHDRNGAVLCDADLWILGASGERYDQYTRDVRAEYAHVPEDAWRSGRAAVLGHFLERPTIYHSEPGVRRERTARANLQRELSRLAR